MIPARKSPFLCRWFAGHVEGRLVSTFSEVRVRGLNHLRQATRAGSVLVVSNHTSWWDPMFCIYLANRLVPVDGYALMHARNLRRLPFLGRVGAFGVEVGNSNDVHQALSYGADLLGTPGRLVWVFPQGVERAISAPLDDFKPGAAIMAEMASQATIIGVGLRYEFGADEKPTLYASIGEPFGFDSDMTAGVARQRDAVKTELDAIDRQIREPNERSGFERVLFSRPSLLSRWAERALAWLTRYR